MPCVCIYVHGHLDSMCSRIYTRAASSAMSFYQMYSCLHWNARYAIRRARNKSSHRYWRIKSQKFGALSGFTGALLKVTCYVVKQKRRARDILFRVIKSTSLQTSLMRLTHRLLVAVKLRLIYVIGGNLLSMFTACSCASTHCPMQRFVYRYALTYALRDLDFRVLPEDMECSTVKFQGKWPKCLNELTSAQSNGNVCYR